MSHRDLKDDAIIAVLTTRCSSAFALIASCWVVLCAQSKVPAPFPAPQISQKKVDRRPAKLFPVQTRAGKVGFRFVAKSLGWSWAWWLTSRHPA